MALALQERLHQRACDSQETNGADHAAGPRQQPELDLREADHGLGVVDDDPVMTGQADLESAAERCAVDRRDDRPAERLEPTEALLVGPDPL